MNLHFKIGSKKIFNAIYIIVALANVAVLILLGRFINDDVYHSIFIDQSFIKSQSIKIGNDLSVDKIQNVTNAINEKKERSILDIKNVF